MASAMASNSLYLLNPNPNISPPYYDRLHFFNNPIVSKPSFSQKHRNLLLNTNKSYILQPASKTRVSASNSPPTVPTNSPTDFSSNFASILSISTLFATAIRSISAKVGKIFTKPNPEELQMIQSLQKNVVCTVGPLFFAALRDRPSGYLNTPLTVVASGMAKWLDIYSGVLMVRVLLSWFPNIPWDRQPLSAIRDLCDPYLNLFRNIIPPVFDTLDVSPLLAFAVLGTLGSILNNSRGSY